MRIFRGAMAILLLIGVIVGLFLGGGAWRDLNNHKAEGRVQLQAMLDDIGKMKNKDSALDGRISALETDIVARLDSNDADINNLKARLNEIKAFFDLKYDGRYDNAADMVSQQELSAVIASLTEIVCLYQSSDQKTSPCRQDKQAPNLPGLFHR